MDYKKQIEEKSFMASYPSAYGGVYTESKVITVKEALNIFEALTKASQLEPLVMQKIADIAEKALTQWKLHIEENEQTDLEDINHLESLEWKKLNAELQSIKSNFSV